MDKQLGLKKIALIGRTFDEYCKIFDLNDSLLSNEIILDVASGVSSFCAEANARGFDVTASDRIYTLSPDQIEEKCGHDLDMIIKQLPDVSYLYRLDFFKDIEALRVHRERAYKLFIEDLKNHGNQRYRPVEYPSTDFADRQFTISLVSHFLFLYEDKLNYDFHKKTIMELLRITSKEIRIFPIVNMKGARSSFVDILMLDKDFECFQIIIEKVGYEFMKNANEMMVISNSRNI